MAALREILASFGLDFPHGEVEKADAGIEGLIGKVKGVGAAFAGAFALHEIKAFIFDIVDQADALRDQATALSLSTEELQAWQHAAALNGVGAEELSGSLQKFNRAVAEASKGTGPAADAFKALGVKVKDASGKLGEPIDLLDGVAAGLQNIHDPAKRTAAAMDLFGRAGARLLPLLSEGPEGLAKLRAEVKDLGGGITNDFADQADNLNDNLERLNLSLKSIKVGIVSTVVPALTSLVEHGTKALNWVRETTKHSKILEAGAVALGARFLPLIANARTIGFALGRLAGALGMVARFAWEFLLPLVAIDDVLTFLAGGDSLTGRGIEKMFGPGSAAKVRSFFRGFVDGTGNAKKLADVAFEAIGARIEKTLGPDAAAAFGWFGRGMSAVIDMVSGGWDNFWNKLRALLDAGMFSFKVVWDDIQTLGLSAAAAISDAFDGMWNSVISGAEGAVDALARILSNIPGAGDLAEGLRGVSANLEGSKRAGDAGETVAAGARRQQKARLAEGEDILGRLSASPAGAPSARAWDPGGSALNHTLQVEEVRVQGRVPAAPSVTQHFDTKNVTNITVPPGTDADVARGVADAATRGASKGADLRAHRAALIHTADG